MQVCASGATLPVYPEEIIGVEWCRTPGVHHQMRCLLNEWTDKNLGDLLLCQLIQLLPIGYDIFNPIRYSADCTIRHKIDSSSGAEIGMSKPKIVPDFMCHGVNASDPSKAV